MKLNLSMTILAHLVALRLMDLTSQTLCLRAINEEGQTTLIYAHLDKDFLQKQIELVSF